MEKKRYVKLTQMGVSSVQALDLANAHLSGGEAVRSK